MSPAVERTLSRLGIDGRQASVLLRIYLKQDLRGGKVASQFGKGRYLSGNRALLSVVGVYTLLGLSVGVLALAGFDVFTYSLICSSYTLFLVAMALMAESGNVILNESEADVLGHLPITARTQLAVKLANLFLFTLLLAGSANLVPSITGILTSGGSVIFTIAHACSTVLVALFATTLVVASYGLLVRYVSKERFDSFVTYSQVGLAVVFMLSYQLMPRLVDVANPKSDHPLRWYHFLYPPAWFSGFSMLLIGKWTAGMGALAGIGILSLIGLTWFAIRKMAFDYALHLESSKAPASEPEPSAIEVLRPTTAQSDDARKMTSVLKTTLLRRPVERAVFDLVTIYLKRNREIKVRIYPALASFVFFPVLVLLSRNVNDPFIATGEAFLLLLTIEMVLIVGLSVLEGLIFSEHHSAAYIFRVTPIENLSLVHSGLRKVVLIYIVAPGYLVTFALLSAMWRNPFHALLAIAPWILLAPTVLLLPFLSREMIPLSRKYHKGEQSARNSVLMIVSMVCLSIFLGVELAAIAAGSWYYWLFLVAVAMGSPIVYVLVRRLTRETKPLAPIDPAESD